MNVTKQIFDGLTVFLAVMAAVYIYLTGASRTGIEWAGGTGLVLAAGLCLLVGAYLRFVGKRINTLPEDYEAAEVSDGAGELGFFSPHSLWPAMMAGAILITGFGAAFWNWWVIIGGAVLLIVTICGLVFEYHWGQEKH